jgi:hypothetical protein
MGIDIHHANIHSILGEIFLKHGVEFPLLLLNEMKEIPQILRALPRDMLPIYKEGSQYIRQFMTSNYIIHVYESFKSRIHAMYMHAPIDIIDSLHDRFTEYLFGLKDDWGLHKEEILKESSKIYRSSNWCEIAMPSLQQNYKVYIQTHSEKKPPKDEIKAWVKTEFNRWTSWANRLGFILHEMEPSFLRDIQDFLNHI